MCRQISVDGNASFAWFDSSWKDQEYSTRQCCPRNITLGLSCLKHSLLSSFPKDKRAASSACDSVSCMQWPWVTDSHCGSLHNVGEKLLELVHTVARSSENGSQCCKSTLSIIHCSLTWIMRLHAVVISQSSALDADEVDTMARSLGVDPAVRHRTRPQV
ncbi:hypothetical protein Ae201684P_005479 [Aphanomyces euteiches]|uniref:Uncharacterized protein n=1 Tax=Aphanomyces euteiches TaxID=100861 RepID=A0A6G0X437_9STRA|nr:hypothetical protein Ae201684_008657 [Aphanomyces euteiches]KAH9085778.1 hypothetical protein Ae201684P_005479 [Aphanomyces euteiches]